MDHSNSVASASAPEITPSHDSLVIGLRNLVDDAQVTEAGLAEALGIMAPYLPEASQSQIRWRLNHGEQVQVQMAILSAVSAATLLLMPSSNTPQGMGWENWLRAVLDAVRMPSIEDVALRQVAFDFLICALADLDGSSSDDEDQTNDVDLASLPTLSLPRFRIIQTRGRDYLNLIWSITPP